MSTDHTSPTLGMELSRSVTRRFYSMLSDSSKVLRRVLLGFAVVNDGLMDLSGRAVSSQRPHQRTNPAARFLAEPGPPRALGNRMSLDDIILPVALNENVVLAVLGQSCSVVFVLRETRSL